MPEKGIMKLDAASVRNHVFHVHSALMARYEGYIANSSSLPQTASKKRKTASMENSITKFMKSGKSRSYPRDSREQKRFNRDLCLSLRRPTKVLPLETTRGFEK